MKASSMKDRRLIALSVVLLLGLWAIVSNIIDNPIYLPKIGELIQELITIILSKEFFIGVISTLIRVFESFFIALIIALILGITSSFNKYLYNFIYPIMSIFKSIPTIAFILIILIWADKNLAAILIGIIIAFPILYEVVQNSILNIDKDLFEMTNVYKISKKDLILHIYLPNIYFNLLNIFTSTISLILKVVIAGEVYGQPAYGIGAAIQLEKINLNTVGIFAWIIIVAIITLIFDFILEIINKINIKRR